MSHENSSRKRSGVVRLALASALALGALAALPASAQMPARFYWKSLSGGNAVPLIFNSLSGNTNPFDPAHLVVPGATVDGTIALAGYAHTFTLFDRAGMVAVLLEMGRLSGEVANADRTISSSARGFGDPTVEFNVNLIGPKAQKNLADVTPYQPGFSLDLIADLVVPIGEYDDGRALNLGQNRWSGRLGFPVVWQFGSWVPGRRTTLELLPAVWLFGPNDDYVGTNHDDRALARASLLYADQIVEIQRVHRLAGIRIGPADRVAQADRKQSTDGQRTNRDVSQEVRRHGVTPADMDDSRRTKTPKSQGNSRLATLIPARPGTCPSRLASLPCRCWPGCR